MKRLKKWVYSNKIVHHISRHLDHEVTETKNYPLRGSYQTKTNNINVFAYLLIILLFNYLMLQK